MLLTLSPSADALVSPARYADVPEVKSAGVTYTPAPLAAFVAEQVLRVADLERSRAIRVLDPAVGDGALLDALMQRLPAHLHDRAEVHGFDTDTLAVEQARMRLAGQVAPGRLHLHAKDFLAHVIEHYGESDLLGQGDHPKFDLVVANPPYVRTQVIGAVRSQQLARTFGLTGRVDLYHAFLLGIARVLRESGVGGVITSNRYMSTKAGQAVRRAVLTHFDVLHVWDLGDTRLFDAAVLPAVLLAKGRRVAGRTSAGEVRLSSIYETAEAPSKSVTDAVAALSAADDSVVALPDGRRFKVRHGLLDNGGDAQGVWRVATESADTWLSTVAAHAWATFRRIGKIRVGVKSTADKVFVRRDWSSLPQGRPELLRPLITRHLARRYRAVPAEPGRAREILYPHEVSVGGQRRAVDLDRFPIARHYLEAHRAVLEARTYVKEAGRAWYELWVPQNPAAWSGPKLVFPDIAEEPVFWMDTGGGVVNGECYWLQAERPDEEDLLWLALAVANSDFVIRFYDHKFSNKLYAGRRRFITQYVEQFPLPDPALPTSGEIVACAKRIYALTPSAEADDLAVRLNALVTASFGLGTNAPT